MIPLEKEDLAHGERAHRLAIELWPITRSITGPGVRETLDILAREIPNLRHHEVPTGYQAFDWQVPNEWTLRRAWIETPDGQVICDTDINNLHVVGYSEPVDQTLTLQQLQTHLYSETSQPDAIPYVTSYYAKNWGFCISQSQRETLPEGTYRAVIDATLKPGKLDYADVVIPGDTEQEIAFSTYICHPSMANNELSGGVVTTELARIVASRTKRKYTYRFIFVPETIGALVYLSSRLEHLKHHVVAGFVVTCVGDENAVSYLSSRAENTLADRAALAVLNEIDCDLQRYSFLHRGSDERQYCAPGIDLPFCAVMKSKYGTFREYHTSLDDLTFVTPKGLAESICIYRRIIDTLEANFRPVATELGEPQLGRRGLYPNVSRKGSARSALLYRNILAYADGERDLIDLAELFCVNIGDVIEATGILRSHKLLE